MLAFAVKLIDIMSFWDWKKKKKEKKNSRKQFAKIFIHVSIIS